MRRLLIHTILFHAIVACVPVAKYKQARNELRFYQNSNQKLVSTLDSTQRSMRDLKADFNSLTYELEEIQRYSSFSDRDLVKELELERANRIMLSESVVILKNKKEYVDWLSVKRAEAFSIEAKCILDSYAATTFLLVNGNIVLLDLEGLLERNKEKETEFKTRLADLFALLHHREDYNLRVGLYQAGLNTDWNKMRLQSEVMSYLVSDAKLPIERIQNITKILPSNGSVEFGFSSNSKIYLEFEFNG